MRSRAWVPMILGEFRPGQAFFAINQPARTAILPKLLPSEQLPAANALSMTVVSAGAIAGPMVGGALIPVLGYAGLYLIDTVLLFATLYAVWRLPSLPVDQPMGTPGLRAVWDGREIRALSLQDSGALSSLAAANALIDRPARAAPARPGEEVLAYLLENGGIA